MSSTIKAMWELRFTLQYHGHSISIKTGVCWGNCKSVIDMKFKVSRSSLGVKLKNFLGA